jgi:LacI family transcriptional regulator
LTIKEIAKELGISTSSVSRALNDYVHTSEETKIKVREVAARLGYRHNILASGLRNNKSRIIGLIVPRLSMSFQAIVVTAIQNKLQEFGYNIIVCQSNESPEEELKMVDLLSGFMVEGIIISCTTFTENFSNFNDNSRNKIPLVFYDRVPSNFPAHIIKGDDYQGAFKATTHLIEQGCKRIAHIGGIQTCAQYFERYKGYRDALIKGGVAYDDGLVLFQELTWENATKACKFLFNNENNQIPDGIFTSNDTTAHAVILFAKSNNIRLPNELKIVGYSNDSRVNISEPTLSSVEQFPNEIGEETARLMMDLIQNKIDPGRNFITLTIPVELMIRKSST